MSNGQTPVHDFENTLTTEYIYTDVLKSQKTSVRKNSKAFITGHSHPSSNV